MPQLKITSILQCNNFVFFQGLNMMLLAAIKSNLSQILLAKGPSS